MIMTRTPLRISLVGGGSDMPEYYKRYNGAVVSFGIDRYVYVMVNPRFDGKFRISYSKTEIVDTPAEIKHDIVRGVVNMFNLSGLEIVSISDVPGNGTGLGSSSALTVGLVKAILTIQGLSHGPKQLAEIAYQVERKMCGHPVGKQDHYAAAYGSANHFEFTKEAVKVKGFSFLDEELAMLSEKMMLFYTGEGHGSDEILRDQAEGLAKAGAVQEAAYLTELANGLAADLLRKDFRHLGRCVKAGWVIKKRLAKGITTPWIDSAIKTVLAHGADGAKICGAGGGGFLLVIAEPNHHEAIESSLDFQRMPVRIGVRGSSVVYQGDTYAASTREATASFRR